MPQTVPVSMSEQAVGRAAQLGLRAAVDQTVEHALRTASGLRGIRVTVEPNPAEPPPANGNDPWLVVWVDRDLPAEVVAEDRTDREWDRWMIEQFPPAVTAYLHLWSNFVEAR